MICLFDVIWANVNRETKEEKKFPEVLKSDLLYRRIFTDRYMNTYML